MFEVKDNGIGIPEKQHSHIFDLFTQAEESTTRQYGGTGLGLAICKKLVNYMDGQISVDSNKDAKSGSVFHFTLWLQKQTTKQSNFQHPSLKNKRALIVASESVQFAFLLNSLQAWGGQAW